VPPKADIARSFMSHALMPGSDQPSAVAFDRTPLIAFYRDRPATSVTLEAKAQKPEVGSELDRPGL